MNYYTGKTLFWPCSGPVRDHVSFNVMNDRPNQVLKPAGAPEVGIAKNR